MIVDTQDVKTSGVVVALLTTLAALTVQSGCAAPHRTPRLAVVVVVDMLPADYLARYGDHFGKGGFKRLTQSGAVFNNANFSFGATLTGPGHATIVTGTTPADHGIIGNQWYRSGTDAPISCVDDGAYMTIGHLEWFDSVGFSPHRLAVPTIGDELKGHYGAEAKVWATALKPRAAVIAAGASGDGAIWFTPKSGDFVSSTFYGPEVPAWCAKLNKDRYADQFFGKTWDRILPHGAYAKCGMDDVPYETGSRLIWMNTLPKVLGQGLSSPSRIYYEQLQSSPFGNELVFEAARQAVTGEALGQDDIPDLLIVSLSSVDYCGHLFGPDSYEMLDMMARTDRQLASWLEFLDQKIGSDQYVVLLTGDHGVGSAPERTQRTGLGGGRIDLAELFGGLHHALAEAFGPTDQQIYYLTAIDLPWIYLNEPVLRFHGVDIEEAAEAVAKAAGEWEGIDTAIVVSRLKGKRKESLTPLESAVANSVFEQRSGQVYMHLERNWYRTGVCAGHGSAHDYDTHVPVVLAGKPFRGGSYDDPVAMKDLAVTLGEVLGIGPPSHASGRVLGEALAR